MPPHTSRVQDLLDAASRLADAERQRFLAEACGDDTGLREEVDSLLAALLDSGAFLERGPVAFDPAPGESPGDLIDRFRLVEVLGEGGFGVVWRATQERPVRREVALKIVKPGMDTPHVLARLESEQQALAMLEHPGVARVYDAGVTPRGRPYFAMELVDGRPLTEYCDGHRLDVRRRVALLVDVCDAIHHAHQRGILHRDLKPSNVLVAEVNGRPLPKVIDFGVAKALKQPLTEGALVATQDGHWVGTPAYMSPEQFGRGGRVDTRIDLYSLGVLLYELLTGTTPLRVPRGARIGPAEIERRVSGEEAEPPAARLGALDEAAVRAVAHGRSTTPPELRRALRDELTWVVGKALEIDPARRYPSVAHLGEDLRRYLAGLPVEAGPLGAWYRLRRSVRRHRVWVTAGAAVTAALLVGSAVATYGMVRAVRAHSAEARERRGAEAVSRVLQDMLASVDPDGGKGREVLVRQVLDEAARKLDDGSLRDQPDVEASVRGTLGRSYVALGDVARAEPQLRKALDLRRQSRGPESREAGESFYDLGTALQLKRDVDGALEAFRQSLRLLRRTTGPTDSTLPLVHCLTDYGIVLGWKDQLAPAEAALNEALDLSRRFGAAAEVAKCIHCLAGVNMHRNDYPAAAGQYREALALYRTALGPEHRQVAIAMGQLGIALARMGQLDEAERLLRQQIAMATRLLGETHPHVVEPQRYLSSVLDSQGRIDEARQVRQSAVAAELRYLSDLIERNPADVLALHRRADDYIDTGRPADALPDYDRLIALEPASRGALLAARARCLAHAARFREALDEVTAALKIDPRDPNAWFLMACLSAYLEDAPAYHARCREMLRHFGATPGVVAGERAAKGSALLPDAVDPAACVRLADQNLAAGEPQMFQPWHHMTKGMTEYRAGHFELAVEFLARSRDGLDPVIFRDHYQAVTATNDSYLAMAHYRLGHAAEARAALRRAADRMDAHVPHTVGGYLRGSIENWLICQIARREAEQLLATDRQAD